jgi:hypothetical protein
LIRARQSRMLGGMSERENPNDVLRVRRQQPTRPEAS